MLEDLRKIEVARAIRLRQDDILRDAKKTCQVLKDRVQSLSNPEGTADKEERRRLLRERQSIVRLLLNRVLVNGEGEVTIEFAVPDLAEVLRFDSAWSTSNGW